MSTGWGCLNAMLGVEGCVVLLVPGAFVAALLMPSCCSCTTLQANTGRSTRRPAGQAPPAATTDCTAGNNNLESS